MTFNFGKAAAVAALGMLAVAGTAEARDQIRIVVSSTVFPFATTVAENFGKSTGFKTPVIESTGSGGGLKLFCQGVGTEHPDITNASRRIKSSEVELCASNGVADITEIKIGFDGIVLGNSVKSETYKLTREQLFLALAKDVPVDGKLVPNPYVRWVQIDSSLPNVEIEVLGPPPTSGTRDAFVELVMEEGAGEIPFLADLKKTDGKAFKQVFGSMREDGKFIEAGENDNLIVQKLEANPSALGIFGFSFLDQNSDKIHGSIINGVAPTFDNIADGSYPVARSLFFYVKNAHVGQIPGIKEFLAEFTSEKAFGETGYLTDNGLIPLPKKDRDAVADAAANLTKLSLN